MNGPVQPGQRARARPFGWDGSRRSLDSDTFDGDPSPIEGVYEIVRVFPADLPPYDDYQIDGRSIDPATLEPA